jgi:hypothetical protein
MKAQRHQPRAAAPEELTPVPDGADSVEQSSIELQRVNPPSAATFVEAQTKPLSPVTCSACIEANAICPACADAPRPVA